MSEPLVSVRGLKKHYKEHDTLVDRLLGRDPTAVRAVDGVSFEIHEGETLGLVGESGCGKSTTGETVLRLQTPTAGTVTFDGTGVFERSDTTLSAFRRRSAIVFQDPFSSLDPRMSVAESIREPLDVHEVGTPSERAERVDELLTQVELSSDQRDRYPHEFSGGQRQRIAIARALALDPEFVVLDEPVSALDVSVQAQIINLLDDLQTEFGLTYLFIAHDLSVVRHICDRVAVMYLGELVEIGPTDELFETPAHPYTQALVESVPRASIEEQHREVEPLAGNVPSPRNPPSGCRFHTRCPAVIPPEGIEIDQAAYREVMVLRDRLERDAVEGGSLAAETDATPEQLRTALFEHSLTGANADTVELALAEVTDGNRERAIELLRNRFESVCEAAHPTLSDASHPTACHLYE